MVLYNKDSKLSEAVLANPQLIPVVNRLGVSLGVGDSSVWSICAHAHIDPDFFLAVVNTFLNEDYFPSNPRGSFSLGETMDYLRKTTGFYIGVQLPNIERHFASLLARSGSDNNLELLRGFFDEMKRQLTDCLHYDMQTLFPALENGMVPAGFRESFTGHAEAEARLHDLLYFFVVHLRGEYDSNLCMAVVTAIFSLDKDYCQNNRIRTRILLPIMEEMERGAENKR